MRSYNSGASTNKQKSQSSISPARHVGGFARKSVPSSEQFDSEEDEVSGKVIARKSILMSSTAGEPMVGTPRGLGRPDESGSNHGGRANRGGGRDR